MTTVGDLVDRVMRDFLEPPDETWVRTALTSAVDDTTTAWPIDLSLLGVEEEDLLGLGVLVEAGSEQATVAGLNASTLTVRRGVRGTAKATHPAGTEVLVAPAFTRTAVFQAVKDALVALHPPLFTVSGTKVAAGVSGITKIPAAVITPTDVRWLRNNATVPFEDLGQYPDPDSELDDPPLVRAIRVYSIPPGQDVLVTYRGRITSPTTEADVLADLGVAEEWGRIVVAAAAAQLIAGKPMSTGWQEYVTAQLRTEAYPVETPGRIRDSLIRYAEYLTEKAAASLLTQYPTGVVFTP